MNFWPILLVSIFSFQKKVQLTIDVSGFANSKGVAYVAVFEEGDQFPVFGKQSKGVKTKIENGVVKTKFDIQANKKYAVAVFHDQNENGKLDKNLFGAPTEAYGFSNNVRNMFSAPTFSQASFNIPSQSTIKIFVK